MYLSDKKKEGAAAAELAARLDSTIAAAERRYLAETARPEGRLTDRAYHAYYRGLLQAIGHALEGVEVSNIDLYDNLFKRVYIPLCNRYGITPKVIDFCTMINLDYTQLYNLIYNSNSNNKLKDIYSDWLLICKEYIISDVLDGNNSTIGNIFILKSIYGLSDQPQKQANNTSYVKQKDRQAIFEELGIELLPKNDE